MKISFIQKKSVKEQVWKSLNLMVGVATILNVSMIGALIQAPVTQAAGNASADLDQCANDPAPSSHTDGCSGSASDWVNGNLGSSKSVYLEGDSVPYRMRFDNLSLGSHTVIIEWDTTKGGKHALDYITSFDRTVATANPCLGVAGCSAFTTYPIPADPQVTGAGVTPIAGSFRLYGGTITGLSAYSYPNGTGFTGDKSARISVTFTASAVNPVLAWGGHIADRHDWGADNSAIAIPGSPYHTRLIDLDGAGGNQDRSLSADAVVFPGSITIVKQASPEGATSFAFTGSPAPVTNFNVVDDGTSANTKVFSMITNFQTYTIAETVPAAWSLDTIQCAVTTANGGSQTVTKPSVSINLKEGENVTCTYNNSRQAGLVTFEKIVSGGSALPSDWTFTVSGVAGSFHSGDSTTLNTGTYTVTESGPAGYSSQSVSGICSALNGNSAMLTVTTNGGTCTFTNSRDTGDLKVIKHVINDNGGNNTAADFSMHIKQSNSDVVTPFAGSESGTTKTLNTGTYVVSETGSPAGYTQQSIVCDGQTTDTITVVKGQLKVCTITNNDVAASITLNKVVMNDNGGNAGVNDFGLTIGGTGVTSGQTLNVNANTPIALNEAGLSGYTFVSLTGDAKCPTQLGGTATLNEGEHITCTITNNDVAPTITLNKVVINNNGGNAGVNDFGLSIGATGVTSGQTLTVNANQAYGLNEAGLPGYTFVSLTGTGCPTQLGGTVTLNEGQNITCTITNDDVAPTITLVKNVINNNGGSAGVNDFGLTVGGSPVTSGQVVSVSANTPYALNEAGLFGYSFVSLTGAGCPTQLGGTVTLNEGQNVTCTITNDDIAPKLTVIKHVINNDGGTAVASDFLLNVNAVNASPSQFNGSETGTLVTVNAGNYEVTEEYFAGYSPAFSADCAGSIAVGQEKTCIVTNTDDTPHLVVIKHVVNDNGGNNVAADFTMHVTGTNVQPAANFPGNELGTTVSLNAGSYSVDETGLSGYTKSLGQDCSGTITLGQTKFCTITNDDQAPTITLTKHVINDNGGTAGANDFGLTIGGTSVNSGQTLAVSANAAIALNEVQVPGYNFVSLTGDAKCPAVLGGTATLNEGEHISCTITNNDVSPQLTVIKHVINDNGGNNLAGNFTMLVSGQNVSSPSFPGNEAGTTVTLNAGSYSVDEQGVTGYDASFGANCIGTIALGEHKTCTVTNDDVAPRITLIKHVINDNGGNATANDFGLTIGATGVTSGQTLNVSANTPIALNEAGLTGYTFVSLTGDGKCPTQLGGTVSLNEGEHITCTITNNDVTPTITLSKQVINAHGGTAGPNDFGLTVGGQGVTSGQTVAVNANTPIALNEAGRFGYQFVDIGGDQLCPSVLGGTVTLNEGQNISCTIANTDIAPQLTVIKHVINDNGGAKTASDFTMNVGGTNVSDSSFPGNESGTTITLNQGSYAVSEGDHTGYAMSTSTDCQGSIAVGQEKTCTITNNDIAAALAVQKNGPDTVQAGDQITYTIDWQVLEPGFAQNAKLVDALPANVTFVSADNGGVYNSGLASVTWTLGTLAAPASGTVHLTVQTNNPEYNGTLVHNSVVFSSDDSQAYADHDTTILSGFEVTVDKVGPATVDSGAQMTYTINWTVSGNSPIDHLVVSDALPANTTFVSASAPGIFDAGTVTWDLGAQSPNANGSVTLTVAVTNLLSDGTIISNTGSVCASSLPSEESGLKDVTNCGDDTTTTEVNSDFSVNIVKTDNIDPVQAGGQVIYTLAWSVSGNAHLSNLVITDPIPANTTFVSASNGGTQSAGTVTWNLGPQNPGDFGTVTLTVQAASPIANGTIVTNVAQVCGQMLNAQEQAVQHCSTDDETTTVTSAPGLSITKSNNVAGFTNPGKTVTYTVVVTNSASATDTAHNVVMTDVLPTGFTYADGGGSTKSWNLGDIAPGASVTTTYVVNISGSQAGGVYTNTASAQGSNTGKVSATSNVEVRIPQILGEDALPEVTITKTVSPTVTNPGKVVTYTVTVKNIGNADATNVVVTDTLPAGFSFVDGGGTIKHWNLGTLKPNHERVINYDVLIASTVKAGFYKNIAIVTADTLGPQRASRQVEVRLPKVLGLATTGVGLRDYLIFSLGLASLGLGLIWLGRQRRAHGSQSA